MYDECIIYTFMRKCNNIAKKSIPFIKKWKTSVLLSLQQKYYFTTILVFFLDIVDAYDAGSSYEKPNRQRSSTICVFECNACLIGATKTNLVIVRNTGRTAKFICIPEDVWYTKSVEVSKKYSNLI